MLSVLLAVCLLAPLYLDLVPGGEPCAANLADCSCTDLTWDAQGPGVEWYEVDRETVSSGAHYAVGLIPTYRDEDGNATAPFNGWTTIKDVSIPRQGTRYRYRVRACNAAGCSAWSNTADDIGWPVVCFDGGHEVPCYVGAPLRLR